MRVICQCLCIILHSNTCLSRHCIPYTILYIHCKLTACAGNSILISTSVLYVVQSILPQYVYPYQYPLFLLCRTSTPPLSVLTPPLSVSTPSSVEPILSPMLCLQSPRYNHDRCITAAFTTVRVLPFVNSFLPNTVLAIDPIVFNAIDPPTSIKPLWPSTISICHIHRYPPAFLLFNFLTA